MDSGWLQCRSFALMRFDRDATLTWAATWPLLTPCSTPCSTPTIVVRHGTMQPELSPLSWDKTAAR